jgi:hypothetical protein
MSTEADLIELGKYLRSMPPRAEAPSVLYVGIRERDGLRLAESILRVRCTTLDFDERQRPDIVADLNTFTSIPWHGDLIVIQNVLQYLLNPARALRILLLQHCNALILQEAVVRNRPNNDPWPDGNRFICRGATASTALLAREVAERGKKHLVDLSEFRRVHSLYYSNPPGVSALWEIRP